MIRKDGQVKFAGIGDNFECIIGGARALRNRFSSWAGIMTRGSPYGRGHGS